MKMTKCDRCEAIVPETEGKQFHYLKGAGGNYTVPVGSLKTIDLCSHCMERITKEINRMMGKAVDA